MLASVGVFLIKKSQCKQSTLCCSALRLYSLALKTTQILWRR